MTYLKCSATTCVYNKNELCSKGDINVMGSDAQHSDETCCGSFRERTNESATNSVAEGGGKKEIAIDCKAGNCTYNEQCKCTAGSIGIAGPGAKDSNDTKCDTFMCKCK